MTASRGGGGGGHARQSEPTRAAPEVDTVSAPVVATARPFPPAGPALVVSLALVIVGGIWMASYFPRPAPLVLPGAASAVSAALLVAAFGLLARVADFCWAAFVPVWRWALLAYVVIAGMIEFAFVHNGAAGAPLTLITIMLVIFAFDVATLIAMTVARYRTGAQQP